MSSANLLDESESKGEKQESEELDFDACAVLDGPIIWALITRVVCLARCLIQGFQIISSVRSAVARALASPNDIELVFKTRRAIEIETLFALAVDLYFRDARQAVVLPKDFSTRNSCDFFHLGVRTGNYVRAAYERIQVFRESCIDNCAFLGGLDDAEVEDEEKRFINIAAAIEDSVARVARSFKGRLADPAAVAEFTDGVVGVVHRFYGPLGAAAAEDVVLLFGQCHIKPADLVAVLQRLDEAKQKGSIF